MGVVTTLKSVNWNNKEILVGCSGGVDSIVLVHGLVQLGIQPTILHVNYQLRGAESDADEFLVTQLASELNLPLIIKKCPKEITKGKGINLQNAARNYRHELFADWVTNSPNHYVALGHHLDDQVETFFLQYYRGSGIYGLGGMHEDRNQLLRPFLNLRKSELIAFAVSNKLNWREDVSNQSTVYLRNLFRLKLLPEIEKKQSDLYQNVALFMCALRLSQGVLENELQSDINNWNNERTLAIATWNAWTLDQQFAFVKGVNLPTWAVQRLNELAETETGKRIEVGSIVIWKTKLGFFKTGTEVTKSPWDYKIQISNILPDKWNKDMIYVDPTLLVGELVVRKVVPDDRIASLGMRGTQLVSKVLKDANVPVVDRDNYWILADERSVLWIPGLKISRSAVATLKSKEIWCICQQFVKNIQY